MHEQVFRKINQTRPERSNPLHRSGQAETLSCIALFSLKLSARSNASPPSRFLALSYKDLAREPSGSTGRRLLPSVSPSAVGQSNGTRRTAPGSRLYGWRQTNGKSLIASL
jgi:hypothetical protein